MPRYTTRQPWTVRLGDLTLTPEQPGPPGGGWQLAGAWALTYGPNGECMYGELGLSADPGLPPDTVLAQIWETADTDRPPDFEGIAGLVRGNRDTTRGAYTLTLTGRREYDAQGLALTLGLEGALPEETVGAYYDRLFADQDTAGWGRTGAGTWVAGAPVGGVELQAVDLHGFTPSGYQRREYVTETSASPGDRWKRLYDTRPPPLPWSPRRYAAAKSDNLVRPDIEREAPYSIQLGQQVFPAGGVNTQPASSAIGAGVTVQGSLPEVTHAGNDKPVDEDIPQLCLSARCVIPISAVARASASSAHAVDATYEAKTCTVTISVGGKSHWPVQPSFSAGAYEPTQTLENSYGTVTWRCYVVASPADTWEQALSREYTGKYSLRADPAVRGNERLNDVYSEPALIPIEVPEDLVTEVYDSLSGGQYSVVIDAEYRLTGAYAWAEDQRENPQNPYQQWYYAAQGFLTIEPPKLLADVLVDAIPAENYPSGWGAASISNPTAQGQVPGVLIPPARLAGDGPQVTEARTIRTETEQYTEFQTGARQTQVLLPSERRLQTAVQNAQGRGGSW